MSQRNSKRKAAYWKSRAATLPEFNNTLPQEQQEDEHRASILWSPQQLPQDADAALDEYLHLAACAHDIEEEQALYVLRSNGYNIAQAKRQLPNIDSARVCRYHRWKAQDLLKLSKAFKKYGDNFVKVREQLPHIPIAEVRQYFYFLAGF